MFMFLYFRRTRSTHLDIGDGAVPFRVKYLNTESLRRIFAGNCSA